MVSFNKLTRTLAGIAAAALIVPLAACGGSGNGGTATAEGIPAKVLRKQQIHRSHLSQLHLPELLRLLSALR